MKRTPGELHTEYSLNESPSEKEGKFLCLGRWVVIRWPSMKVPPKRKGNC